jgi:hypothetical protein
MGGGGSQPTSQISMTSGGLAYPTTTGGGGFDYGALGKAFASAGNQYAQGAEAGAHQNYMTGSTIPSQQTYGNGNLPDTLIPSVQDLKQNSKDDLAQALQRLLASGGAQSSKLRQAWDWNFRSSGMPTELLQPNFTPYMGLV